MYIDHIVFFRETTFRPLGDAAPSNFYTSLEIDQGFLAHTGGGCLPNNFNRD